MDQKKIFMGWTDDDFVWPWWIFYGFDGSVDGVVDGQQWGRDYICEASGGGGSNKGAGS